MRTIELDDDVYLFIAQNTQEIGESASDILRRLLALSVTSVPGLINTVGEHEFATAMVDPKFLIQYAAVDRLLYFLGVAYKQNGANFEKLLAIQGRDRKYFAKSKEEIESSGNSTQPRNVPNSPYWIMTNSPTPQKRKMLRDALKLLGYSEAAISAAVSTIK